MKYNFRRPYKNNLKYLTSGNEIEGMDYYRCEKCNKVFDEFEMNYRDAQIDKKTLCGKCRKEIKEKI